MGERELQRMLADACLGVGSQASFAADLRAFLAGHGVAPADADAICTGPRLALYRRLVRNNLEQVVGQMMPRARARLNAMAQGAFDASLAAFLHETGPRTHHLRDVPAEFLAWVAPRWRTDARVPPWTLDLATHEHVEFLVGAAPFPEKAPQLDEVTLDRPLVFAEVRRFLRYDWAVHDLPSALDDRTEPVHRPVALLAYRDADNEVRFMETSPVAASILERLFGGATLKDGIAGACDEHGVPMDDALLAGTAHLLADLGKRGVLLGAAPA